MELGGFCLQDRSYFFLNGKCIARVEGFNISFCTGCVSYIRDDLLVPGGGNAKATRFDQASPNLSSDSHYNRTKNPTLPRPTAHDPSPTLSTLSSLPFPPSSSSPTTVEPTLPLCPAVLRRRCLARSARPTISHCSVRYQLSGPSATKPSSPVANMRSMDSSVWPAVSG